jgi:plastocyanin
MLRARLVVPAAVFVLSAVTAALPSITSAAADSVAVVIHDGGDPSTWGYGPSSITTITVGQAVTFTNSGTSPHDATSSDGSWKTPLLQSGASASVTFSTPGSFDFACVLHPWMKGTVIVTPLVSAPAPATVDASAPAPATVDASAPAPATVDISAPAPAPASADAAPVTGPAPQTDATVSPADDGTAADAGTEGG